MVKDVFSRFIPVALAVAGWFSFIAGVLIEAPALFKLVLLAVARVLPRALWFHDERVASLEVLAGAAFRPWSRFAGSGNIRRPHRPFQGIC